MTCFDAPASGSGTSSPSGTMTPNSVLVHPKAVSHPAKFSDPVLNRIEFDLQHLRITGLLLDPFAGVGGIHTVHVAGVRTVGIEIEPEWAASSSGTIVGDALKLPFSDDLFAAAATSPVYGNRASDHHNARDGSKRITYRHTLGRELSPGNAGQLQWGDKYREFHRAAWRELQRVLRPGGTFFLNVSNHIRDHHEMPVVEFHLAALIDLGFLIRRVEPVPTRRLKFGANRNARVHSEHVVTAVNP